ncbi:hypothetical protein I302_100335 [Kwoniella bestiolae CBS 10118]|uniref:Uncharacterized protein n=1 Tax=Kwoniella bestiolae CBS 10118 TaxID=1296100 RepID=A0A1B9G4V5_9TREE|nr:hypothetical protein I302_03707 [Kwoniella bestiolae CBS 10118]OCF26030.1 hypothetical protein I302_03707 [Kwoniella bestiolae CBS 10118]
MTRSRRSSITSIKSAASSVLYHLIPGRRKSQTSTRPERPTIDTSFASQSALSRDDPKSSRSTSEFPNFSRPLPSSGVRHDSGYSSTTTTPLSSSAPLDQLPRSEEYTSLAKGGFSSGRPSLSDMSRGNGSIDDLRDNGAVLSATYSRWGHEWRSTPPNATPIDQEEEEEEEEEREEDDDEDWISGSSIPQASPVPSNDTDIDRIQPRGRTNTGSSLLDQHSDANDLSSSNGNGRSRDSLNKRSLEFLRSLDSRIAHPKAPRTTRVSHKNGSWLGADDFAEPLPESLRIYPPVQTTHRSREISTASHSVGEGSNQLERYGNRMAGVEDLASMRTQSSSEEVTQQRMSDEPHEHQSWGDKLRRVFSRSSLKSSHSDNSIFSGGRGRRRSIVGSIMDVFSRSRNRVSNVRYIDTPKVELDDGSEDRSRPRLSRTASGISTATTRLGRMRDELVDLFSGLTRSSCKSDGGEEVQTTGNEPYLTLNMSDYQPNSDSVTSESARTDRTDSSDHRNRRGVKINRELYFAQIQRERDLNSFDAGIRDRNRFDDQRSSSVSGGEDLVVYEVGHLPG